MMRGGTSVSFFAVLTDHEKSNPAIAGENPWSGVAEAFGRKADVYESFGKDHPNLDRMRSKVRRHLMARLLPGANLLEINAGNGVDAAYLASCGYRVHATDVSAAMVRSIEAKIASMDLEGRLTAERISFTELDQLEYGQFDGVFSNLGGVNCIQDLKQITSRFPQLLKPEGLVVWVVMPPFCLWEFAQILRGHFRLAFRRLRRKGADANIEGVLVKTYYHSPRRVQAAFGPKFKRLKLEGLSVFTPPADHKTFSQRYPNFYRWLAWLDQGLADRYPFNRWGDFYILSLQYLP